MVPLNRAVFGTCPMAMKIPSQSSLCTWSVCVFLNITVSTPFSCDPIISSTVELYLNDIFRLDIALSTMIFDARNSSRRWTTTTSDANFVRKVASSIAESPPPTTKTFLSLKKKPSQVAQADTPCPISLVSDSSPNKRADAPVEIIIASAKYSSLLTHTMYGLLERSTLSTVLYRHSAPKR